MIMKYNIENVDPADYQEVVELWEASVRATHHFLSEADIQFFKPLILNEFLSAVTLRCIREAGILMGFLGVAEGKLEMLFVHPGAMGKGIGKQLIQYGMAELGVVAVDVNEDNPNATGFYKHLGFKIEKRSPLDAMGKPFPILHMVKED